MAPDEEAALAELLGADAPHPLTTTAVAAIAAAAITDDALNTEGLPCTCTVWTLDAVGDAVPSPGVGL